MPRDQRTFTSRLEIFQTGRPICAMSQGGTLRILDAEHFRVVWTADDWSTNHVIDSRRVGRPGSFVDLQTDPKQRGTLIFTLYWPEQDRWLGKNYEVQILEGRPSQQTAAEKPQS